MVKEKDCPVCEEVILTTSRGTKVCENCGMSIRKRSSGYSLEVDGMKKYFCKERCMSSFLKGLDEVIEWKKR